MLVQLIVVVKSLAAEAAWGVALEAGLVSRTRLVVAVHHMLLQLLFGKELMFVGKNALVPGTQVTHAFAVGRLDMAVEVWPSEAGEVAGWLGAVVAQ